MRLTLRTLLAYLDNTLEPADAEILRAKVAESGFAGQLVQRIRSTLGRADLAAPAPDAVGPVEEANLISEFLDSTLPAEQVAEIERACLESDTQLAEAAACHQILTMVLGKSADVPPKLRDLIYSLPDRNIADIATAGSFAAVSIPSTDHPDSHTGQRGPQDASPLDISEAPTLEKRDLDAASVSPSSSLDSSSLDSSSLDSGSLDSGSLDSSSLDSNAVQPVGPEDSGVSDAPTRIRRSDIGTTNANEEAIAGSRPRSALEAAQWYGGTIRTSRVAPWLVSLALAAVLLFALVRIFDPLLNSKTTADRGLSSSTPMQTETDPGSNSATTNDANIEGKPAMEENGTVPASDAADTDNASDAAETGSQTAERTSEIPTATTPERAGDSGAEESDLAATADESGATADESGATADESGATTVMAEKRETTESAPADQNGDIADEDAAVAMPTDLEDESIAMSEPVEDSERAKEQELDPDAPQPAASDTFAARMTNDATLVFAVDSETAPARLIKDSTVAPTTTVVCAPTYRVRMDTVGKLAVTLVGPTQVQWVVDDDDDDQVVLKIDYGQLLIEALTPGAEAKVQFGDQTFALTIPGIETLLAVSASHVRLAGFDPLNPENRVALTEVVVSQGEATLNTPSDQFALATGQRWSKLGNAEVEISDSQSMPDWIAPPDSRDRSLETSAREGLYELIRDDQPAELWLRESTLFRRSEVGALAARTLLALDRPDVYFGGDGILNEPEQRSYWNDHYRALIAAVDRDAATAGNIRDAIIRMDSANAMTLFQLLVGFSDSQLAEGADQKLVAWLDSPSMAVRALAIENLRRITGETMNYRPEQDNALRRSQVVKKWEARQRRGDIRWQSQ